MTVDSRITSKRTAVGVIRPLAAIAAILVAIAAPVAQPAAAQQPATTAANQFTIDQVEAMWSKLSPKQQFIAIEQLLREARFDVAERLLNATDFRHTGDRAIKRFYQGMVARGQGRNQQAMAIFREVLADNPDFTRVRLELAHLQFAINEDASARHNFELVLGGASATPGLQDTVRSYINAIEGRKRWNLTTFVTIAPSSNLNQGASAESVALNGLPLKLSEKNVRQSGVGFYGGFQAGYKQPLTDTIDLVVSGGGQAKRYRDGDFNDSLVNASIGPKLRFDGGFLGLYGVVDHRWMADSNYATSFGGLLSGGLSLTATDLLFADLGCSRRRFDTAWQATDLSYQDGYFCFLSGRYDHHFDSRTYMRALGNLGQEQTGRDHLDNRSRGAGLGVYREMPWGIGVYLQGLFTVTNFDGIYPSFSEARHDNRFDASLNLTKRDLVLFGFAPMVQYTYTHNDSNIPLHDYDAHAVALTLTKRF
jgi:outer membrane protein